jgi:hypothetical protein
MDEAMPDSPIFTIDIASPPDREKVVAEIFVGDTQWSELSCEIDGHLVAEFYPRPDGTPWRFPFREALEALERAAARLCSS